MHPKCEGVFTGDDVPCFISITMIRKEDIQKIMETYPGREGLFIVELKVSPSNKISLFADRMEGITIEECVRISRFIEHKLDREKEDFELVVSSPGLDMPLRVKEQYLKNTGKNLKVTLRDHSEIKGKLIEVNDHGIVIEKEQKKGKKKGSRKKTAQEGPVRNEYAFDEIEQAKLIIEFK